MDIGSAFIWNGWGEGAKIFVLCALVYVAGRAALEMFCAAMRLDEETPLCDSNYVALALGPVVVLLLTWLLKVLHAYSYASIVGSLAVLIVAGLTNARFRTLARRPWRVLSPISYAYALAAFTFWLILDAGEYPLRKATSMYLLQGFNIFQGQYAAMLPQFGTTFIAPILYTGHLISATFGMFSYGDHFQYYVFGEYWLNLLIAPVIPIGAFLLFRRFLPTLYAILAASAFCTTILGLRVWSLRGESFAWIIGFGFLLVVVTVLDHVKSAQTPSKVLRFAPLLSTLFFGLILTHGVTAIIVAIFAFAYAASFVLTDRNRNRFVAIAAVGAASAAGLLVLLFLFSLSYSGTSSPIENTPRPVSGQPDAAIEFDNAWVAAPLDEGTPTVLMRPPYVAPLEMVAMATFLPVASLVHNGIDDIALRDFPSQGIAQLHTLPALEKLAYAALPTLLLLFYLSPLARRSPWRLRSLTLVSLAIYIALVAFSIYLDYKSVALYPLAAIRRTWVYSEFFYWLAVGTCAWDIASYAAHELYLRSHEARDLSAKWMPLMPVLRRMTTTLIVVFAALWLLNSVNPLMGRPVSAAWLAHRAVDRLNLNSIRENGTTGADANLRSTFEAMKFIRDHTKPGDLVYSNVLSSDNKFWFLTSGRYSTLEGSGIYQLYFQQKAAAQRMSGFADFAITADPALIASYNIQYVTIYTGSSCRAAQCYGEVLFPTSLDLFIGNAAFNPVFQNDDYRIYHLTGRPADARTRAVAHTLEQCKSLLASADARITACKKLPRYNLDAHLYYARATERLAQRQYLLAIADLNQVIILDPQNTEAYYRRALANAALKRDVSAFMDASTTIQRDPNSVRTRPEISRLLDNAQAQRARRAVELLAVCTSITAKANLRIAACTEILSQLRRLEPGRVSSVLVQRGLAYAESGSMYLAIGDFEAALSRDPKNASAYLGLASIARGEGDQITAARDLSRAIAADPKNVDAFFLRGSLRIAQGKYEVAESDFDHVIRIDPTYGGAYYQLAVISRARGDNAAAIAYLRHALRENPNLTPAWKDLDALLAPSEP